MRTPDSRWFALALLLVAAVRWFYIDHPVQGDDYYYLRAAMHGQIDPLHPHHARYVFQGKQVDMRGHPHPPLNVLVLTGILRLAGDVREPFFHGLYALFSLMIVAGTFFLARRFTPEPGWAALLMAAVPAFLVQGNSLESDIPFVAFWTTGIAAFVSGRLWLAVPLLVGAGLAAYQSVAVIPILWLWLWLYRRDWRAGWLVAVTPALAIIAFNLWERASSGAAPVAVAVGYFNEYGLQRLERKIRNALALSSHFFFIVGPVGLALALWRRRAQERADWFLWGWTAIFFATALVLFFAGSARYLLPIAPALAIWVSRQLAGRPLLLGAAFAAQFVLGIALAQANYEHWQAYRDLVATLRREIESRRVWINGEFTLRHYAEALGALPLEQGQAVRPGDMVLTSALTFPIRFTTGGGAVVPLREVPIRPGLPLRLLGLNSRSGWSTEAQGLRPFGVTSAPADFVRVDTVVEREPTLAFVKMADGAAESHIVSGLYQLEPDACRWSGERAVLMVRSAAGGLRRVAATVYVPEIAPARRLAFEVDGVPVGEVALPGPGLHKVRSEPVMVGAGRRLVGLRVDKAFQPAGDTRTLGVKVLEMGVVEP